MRENSDDLLVDIAVGMVLMMMKYTLLIVSLKILLGAKKLVFDDIVSNIVSSKSLVGIFGGSFGGSFVVLSLLYDKLNIYLELY